ncbi:MAG: type II toxin-antitoxin system VapB family antitoxin [Candidatus Margulisbacteria bacterium]|jgi:antitoxin VapB|nr:type II toxin-antitoxin system VapB family antitoxin [Candidatus Margulisiibacteriota bacterium]
MEKMLTRVFTSGNSQAVRLPKQFRLASDKVYITKDDERLVITPKTKLSWQSFFAECPACPDFTVKRNTVTRHKDFF